MLLITNKISHEMQLRLNQMDPIAYPFFVGKILTRIHVVHVKICHKALTAAYTTLKTFLH
jgi:hypothetical protein